MATSVGDFLIERLRDCRVKHVFAYPGDGINGIVAAFQATGYAKFSGDVGVCMATSGPGAIHLLNGLYGAKLDRVPVVAIVGQTARSALGGSYQQEIDLQSLYKDVASDMNSNAPTPETDNSRNGFSPLTVVVTGASAGIGRAVVREFAATGARIGLIARGRAGLEAGAEEVEKSGGTAFVAPADVSDYEAVDRAADMIEEELGPIDVWINGAFATIFAPFTEITPDEFRRASEVTYLGAVHGTMVALKHMRPRDRGTIIQIGSALAKRSIPLQSAYCGAKHGIDGFTESLRTELLHDRSGVHVTVVRMPGVNTPQFAWVRSRLARQPRPVAPVYQPEVAARAVLYAAKHPMRKQYWVGGSTVLTVLGQRAVPAVLDRYLARTGLSSQQTAPDVGHEPGNLFSPLDDAPGTDHGAHGIFDDEAHDRSPAWWLRSHARGLTAAAALSTAAIIAGAAARARQRQM